MKRLYPSATRGRPKIVAFNPHIDELLYQKWGARRIHAELRRRFPGRKLSLSTVSARIRDLRQEPDDVVGFDVDHASISCEGVSLEERNVDQAKRCV